ncbi:MAG: hypothetical protein LBS98_03040 [Coriobacteriales bacterium]|jgi:hypothetical protein|nr:hypothetical protein [Coriobacteriales bacterium]
MAQKVQVVSNKKVFCRSAMAILIALSLVMFGSVAAYAGSASGSTMTFTVGSKTYMAYNYVYAIGPATGLALAETRVCSTSSAPSGYLGSAARLYNGSVLDASSSTYYSSGTYGAGTYFSTTAMNTSAPSGNYNSYGYALGYNPSTGGYTTALPARSPNQSV